jgi:hypothetical protein
MNRSTYVDLTGILLDTLQANIVPLLERDANAMQPVTRLIVALICLDFLSFDMVLSQFYKVLLESCNAASTNRNVCNAIVCSIHVLLNERQATTISSGSSKNLLSPSV